MTIVVVYVLSLLLMVSGKDDIQKRILLNDPDAMNTRIHQLEVEVQSLKPQLATSAKGVLYTVWGRRTCPNNESELVYSGMAGGGLYSNPGSPAEYVCLPYDPDLILNEVTSNPFGSIGHIYGAEYEDNFFGQKVFENDVPCAVCNNPKKSLTMMIPGKTTCVPGWQVEYSGRLASGADSENAASQYVCVHALPDVLENGLSNDNGKLFYPVRVVCGSLHCPPYENNALMPCVVCSK